MNNIPDEFKLLNFNDAYINENELWVSSLEFNGLFKVDRKLNKAKYICSFPGQPIFGERLHSRVLKWKDILYFFPNEASEISAFNLKSYEIRNIVFDNIEIHTFCVYALDNLCWIFPKYETGVVLLFDMDNEKLIVEEKLSKKINNFKAEVYGRRFLRMCTWDGELFLPMEGTENILRLNLKTQKSQVISFKNCNFKNIAVVDKNVWLDDEKGQLFQLDKEENHIKKFNYVDNDSVVYKNSQMFGYNDNLLLFSEEFNKIYSVTNNEILKLEMPQKLYMFDINRKSSGRFIGMKKYEDNLWVFPSRGNEYFVLSSDLNVIEENEIIIDMQNLEEFFDNVKKEKMKSRLNSVYIKEDLYCNLNSFLVELSKNVYMNKSVYNCKSYGVKIWNKLREE